MTKMELGESLENLVKIVKCEYKKRDTKIAELEKEIEEQNKLLLETDNLLAEGIAIVIEDEYNIVELEEQVQDLSNRLIGAESRARRYEEGCNEADMKIVELEKEAKKLKIGTDLLEWKLDTMVKDSNSKANDIADLKTLLSEKRTIIEMQKETIEIMKGEKEE